MKIIFSRLGELKLGDVFPIKMPHGVFAYEIVETTIVDADDVLSLTLRARKC